MIVVTGGAGFIGSCIIRMLNDIGRSDILVVDHIAKTNKWMNLSNKRYLKYIRRDEFLQYLPHLTGRVSHIIHMGACSATTEQDFDFLYRNNFEYTKELYKFCTNNQISFIYASSAATYGNGSQGFDDEDDIRKLKPLNGYGYSKHVFDLWESEQILKPKQCVGLKFFNVYGPNEYFKGSMASVVFHSYNKIREMGKIELFKSYRSTIKDGEQVRDFIYVKDICKVVKFMIQNQAINGLFNLGTGLARSFFDLGLSTFEAMGLSPKIQFIDMPEELRGKYQYYTQAKMSKLRRCGYEDSFYTLENGIKDYVQNFLMHDFEIY